MPEIISSDLPPDMRHMEDWMVMMADGNAAMRDPGAGSFFDPNRPYTILQTDPTLRGGFQHLAEARGDKVTLYFSECDDPEELGVPFDELVANADQVGMSMPGWSPAGQVAHIKEMGSRADSFDGEIYRTIQLVNGARKKLRAEGVADKGAIAPFSYDWPKDPQSTAERVLQSMYDAHAPLLDEQIEDAETRVRQAKIQKTHQALAEWHLVGRVGQKLSASKNPQDMLLVVANERRDLIRKFETAGVKPTIVEGSAPRRMSLFEALTPEMMRLGRITLANLTNNGVTHEGYVYRHDEHPTR